MTLSVVYYGADTIECSFEFRISTAASNALERFRQRAIDTDSPQQINLLGIEFAIQSYGRPPYRYTLVSDVMELRFVDSEKVPGAFVHLGALGLALYGPEVLLDLAEQIIDLLGDRGRCRLSRLDVCVDFQGYDPSADHESRFVCPAKYRVVYPNIEHPETYDMGRKPMKVRIYAKTVEILHSDKRWMYDVWEASGNYDPELPVWRLETQIRRQRLRELGLDTPEDALRDLNSVVQYALGWCDRRVPEGESSDRWPRHWAWEALAAAHPTDHRLTREQYKARLCGLERLAPAVAGYVISAGARLDVSDFDEAWEILRRKVRARFEDEDSYATAVKARQLERL